MSSAPSSADETRESLARCLRTAASQVRRAIESVAASNPVVLIDGRSGVGKTTLAQLIVADWPDHGRVQYVALDSLYPGWDGLAAGAQIALDDILAPYARGEVGVWRRYDWSRGAPAEAREVDPGRPLVVEGSGLLTPATARFGDVRVWIEAPDAARKNRALTRDGETYRPHWDRWAAQEDDHIARNSPATLATLSVSLP